MAKELYDGIYSSHKLVFMEKVERNLKFYLKERLIYVRNIGQELFCVIDRGNLKEVLAELKENPEISNEVLNSIDLFHSKDGYCVLIGLSSISNNYSMILKVLLQTDSFDDARNGYKEVCSVIRIHYGYAESYQAVSISDDDGYDARVISQPAEGLDCFDIYITFAGEKIDQAYFDTSISRVLSNDLFRGAGIANLLVYLSRFDPGAGIFPEICYCHAIEELVQLKVSKRVQHIRMLLSEFYRISNHLYYLSRIGRILGYDFAYNQALMEREKILRLLETITGARVNPNFIRIGGVKNDLGNETVCSIRENLKGIFKKINNLEALMLDNSVITARLKNLGIAGQNTAVELGVTGPNLRASGARYDLRKNRNLLLYKDISFLVPSAKYGDCLDRIQIRFREIYQSTIIISQIMKSLPDEHIRRTFDPADLDLPFSEMISSIECPHGVFKIFLEAEGDRILDMIIIGPSRNSLYLAEKVIQDTGFEDLELILSSFDISSGEIIRK